MNIIEQVRRAVHGRRFPFSADRPPDYKDAQITRAAVTAFLEAITEQGWRIVPDEATEEMKKAVSNHGSLAATTWVHYADIVYREYLDAAPKFKLDEEHS